ncbi:hypothetical protein AOLI_G00194890 [Acnodon oligacanthus]
MATLYTEHKRARRLLSVTPLEARSDRCQSGARPTRARTHTHTETERDGASGRAGLLSQRSRCFASGGFMATPERGEALGQQTRTLCVSAVLLLGPGEEVAGLRRGTRGPDFAPPLPLPLSGSPAQVAQRVISTWAVFLPGRTTMMVMMKKRFL